MSFFHFNILLHNLHPIQSFVNEVHVLLWESLQGNPDPASFDIDCQKRWLNLKRASWSAKTIGQGGSFGPDCKIFLQICVSEALFIWILYILSWQITFNSTELMQKLCNPHKFENMVTFSNIFHPACSRIKFEIITHGQWHEKTPRPDQIKCFV